MRIYAPDGEGPELDLQDRFVLSCHALNEQDRTKENAYYWNDLSASEARRIQDGNGPWRLIFRPETNTGGRKDEQLTGRTFSLWHQPTGTARGQRLVFESEPEKRVFALGQEDAPNSIYDNGICAVFVATKLYASDEVQLARTAARDLGIEDRVTLREPDHLKDESSSFFKPDEPLRAEPLTDALSSRVRWGAGQNERIWPLGNAPSEAYPALDQLASDENEDIALLAKDLQKAAEAVSQVETWLYLYAARARNADGTQPLPRCVGLWQVDAEGRYNAAAYPEGTSLEAVADPRFITEVEEDGEALPEVIGAPSPYILIDTALVHDSGETVFAYTSPVQLPRARCCHVGYSLWGTPQLRMPSLDFTSMAGAMGQVYEEQRRHAGYDPEERIWKWYLPDTYRTALCSAVVCLEAASEVRAFERLASVASSNAGLIEQTCYSDVLQRTYLRSSLVEGFWSGEGPTPYQVPSSPYGTGIRDYTNAPLGAAEQHTYWLWKGFDPEKTARAFSLPWQAPLSAQQDRSVTSRARALVGRFSQLALYQWGAACQRIYLKARALTAGHRLEVWWHSEAFKLLREDLVVGCWDMGSEADEPLRRLATELWDIGLAMLETGAGITVLGLEYEDSGLPSAARQTSVEDLPKLIEPLGRETSWAAAVKEPAFKIGWTLMRRVGGKQAGKHLEMLGHLGAFDYETSPFETLYKGSSLGTRVIPSAGAGKVVKDRVLLGVIIEKHAQEVTTEGRAVPTAKKAAVSYFANGKVKDFRYGDVWIEATVQEVPGSSRADFMDYRFRVEADAYDATWKIRGLTLPLYLDTINVAFAWTGLYTSLSDGKHTWGDAIAIAKTIADTVKFAGDLVSKTGHGDPASSLVVKSGVMGGTGRRLAQTVDPPKLARAAKIASRAAVILDAAATGYAVFYTLQRDPQAVGMTSYANVNPGAIAGTLVSFAGSAAIGGAAVLGLTLTTPLVVGAVAAMVIGQGIIWVSSALRRWEAERSDPLSTWLGENSFWAERDTRSPDARRIGQLPPPTPRCTVRARRTGCRPAKHVWVGRHRTGRPDSRVLRSGLHLSSAGRTQCGRRLHVRRGARVRHAPGNAYGRGASG